jgi:hypothetical protein
MLSPVIDTTSSPPSFRGKREERARKVPSKEVAEFAMKEKLTQNCRAST